GGQAGGICLHGRLGGPGGRTLGGRRLGMVEEAPQVAPALGRSGQQGEGFAQERLALRPLGRADGGEQGAVEPLAQRIRPGGQPGLGGVQEFPAVAQHQQAAVGIAAGQLLQAQAAGVLLIPAIAGVVAV
ncbi:hypothetical protein RZS08_26040, partial [Arthrospira platensis SPKY1]|nr:hypothetical protein [Arthrospira platensis SPKY1]